MILAYEGVRFPMEFSKFDRAALEKSCRHCKQNMICAKSKSFPWIFPAENPAPISWIFYRECWTASIPLPIAAPKTALTAATTVFWTESPKPSVSSPSFWTFLRITSLLAVTPP